MTTRSELEALLERLEGAKEGSNALDVMLEVAFFQPSRVAVDCRANAAGTKVIYTYANPEKDTYGTSWARDYSTSIDAAVTLTGRVLEGAHVAFCTHPKLTGWLASVGSWADRSHADAPTPALALCKALVRALIAEAGR